MANSFLNFKRVFWAGLKNFVRNGWLSVATASIMTLTLIVIGILLVLNVIMSGTIEYLEDRLDISVYLKPDTTEDTALQIKSDLEGLTIVTEVQYISKDEALVDLLESKNIEDRDVIQRGIEEIGTNPLGHTLNVQTETPEQYDVVEEFLSQEQYQKDVSHVSIKEDIISKVDRTSKIIKGIGLGLSLLFAGISILITFNAIRITIYNFRHEIEIMRLVGASHWFIRLPFMIEGMLYGMLACIVTIGLLYPSIYYISDKVSGGLPDLDLKEYFNSHAILLFVFLSAIGILIGGVSSYFAIRRYLQEAGKNSKLPKKVVKK